MSLTYITLPNGVMSITEGIIVHQVNCLNRIGAGVSGPICKKYPEAEKQYHAICEDKGAKGVFGLAQIVPVTDKLTIVNLFSQFSFGNPMKTGKRYTDYDALTNGLRTICERYPNQTVYIPYNIGCGFGGGDWSTVTSLIEDLSITIVKMPL